MSTNKKRGITLTSLVVYIVLFTGFTIFVSTITGNANEELFYSRGEAANYTNLNKLQYNIEDSALKSNNILISENSISYSNGDNYRYDSDKKTIYKNDGVLCVNVESFSVSIEEASRAKKVTIELTLSKYLNTITKTIVSCVEA